MMVKTKETPKRKTVAERGGKKFETKPVPKPKSGGSKKYGGDAGCRAAAAAKQSGGTKNHTDTGQALEHFWKYKNIRSRQSCSFKGYHFKD